MGDKMSDMPNRREFFRSAGRWGVAAALAALATVLTRTAVRRRAWHTCTSDGICRGCGELAGCVLPQAISTKRETGKGSGNGVG